MPRGVAQFGCMRNTRQMAALALVLVPLAACQQADQTLPFELDGGGQTTIGINGGLISIPPSFSLEIPAGAFAGNTDVTAQERLTAFPNDAGALVPISAYDISVPPGTVLLQPARVQIAVPTELLEAGEELSLSVALLTAGGDIVTQVTTYDLTSGLLTADITELGPVAAVVAADAIPVGDLDDLPSLGGGSIAPPAPVSGPAGAPQYPDGVEFEASCSTQEQQCFSSGIVQLWVDDVVRARLGQDMALLNTTVNGRIEFFGWVNNLPTQVEAFLEVQGYLRTRLNSAVVGRRVTDEVMLFTGGGTSVSPTTVTFSTGQMTLAQTSEGSPEVVGYSVAGVGTGEQLTLRLRGELEFSNQSGPPTIGIIVAHVRLRR